MIEKAFDYLEKNNLINYGLIISADEMQKALGIERSDTWKWLGPYLQLKEYIEERGFYCTSRGCEKGALRILQIEDMWAKSAQIQKNILRRQKKAVNSMLNVSAEELDNEQYVKHFHYANKLSTALYAMKSQLASL